MRTVLLVLAAACLANVAEADENWQLLLAIDHHGGGALNLLVDVSSIKRRQGLITALKKTSYSNPRKRSDLPPQHDLVEMIAVDCENERWALAALTQYDARGRVVRSISKPSPDQYEWHAAGTDNGNDLVLKAVCVHVMSQR